MVGLYLAPRGRPATEPFTLSLHPTLPLLLPPYWQVLPQLLQAEPVGFVATEDRFDDVRREAGQAEHAADVGAVAADVPGQVFQARVLAGRGCQQAGRHMTGTASDYFRGWHRNGTASRRRPHRRPIACHR